MSRPRAAETADSSRPGRRRAPLWQRLAPWLVTAACFAYLYARLDRAASADGQRLLPYLTSVFENVSWSRWLALMLPYCVLFLLIDSLVIWRAISWFNARIRYADVLPIRASAYILSIVNEQVSKGAIALYLSRREGVPAWEVGSSVLFIMFCEWYYLLGWATLGVLLQWDRLPPVFHLIPWMTAASAVFFVVFHLFFTGRVGAGLALRARPVFRAFRR